MLDYLLPIGSVVTLEEGKHKLMIFGVKQTHSETGKLYDYAGVLYPEGNVGTEYQMLFNHDKIKSVEFRGYENEERERFIKKIPEVILLDRIEQLEEWKVNELFAELHVDYYNKK